MSPSPILSATTDKSCSCAVVISGNNSLSTLWKSLTARSPVRCTSAARSLAASSTLRGASSLRTQSANCSAVDASVPCRAASKAESGTMASGVGARDSTRDAASASLRPSLKVAKALHIDSCDNAPVPCSSKGMNAEIQFSFCTTNRRRTRKARICNIHCGSKHEGPGVNADGPASLAAAGCALPFAGGALVAGASAGAIGVALGGAAKGACFAT
mmetsp:Transcript_71147/g.123408  ORF Transcript_71147/g.123408 Transcript_71147/m.123408 type:complete len:215 (+) Transcript_71147:329-973(+)